MFNINNSDCPPNQSDDKTEQRGKEINSNYDLFIERTLWEILFLLS